MEFEAGDELGEIFSRPAPSIRASEGDCAAQGWILPKPKRCGPGWKVAADGSRRSGWYGKLRRLILVGLGRAGCNKNATRCRPGIASVPARGFNGARGAAIAELVGECFPSRLVEFLERGEFPNRSGMIGRDRGSASGLSFCGRQDRVGCCLHDQVGGGGFRGRRC